MNGAFRRTQWKVIVYSNKGTRPGKNPVKMNLPRPNSWHTYSQWNILDLAHKITCSSWSEEKMSNWLVEGDALDAIVWVCNAANKSYGKQKKQNNLPQVFWPRYNFDRWIFLPISGSEKCYVYSNLQPLVPLHQDAICSVVSSLLMLPWVSTEDGPWQWSTQWWGMLEAPWPSQMQIMIIIACAYDLDENYE